MMVLVVVFLSLNMPRLVLGIIEVIIRLPRIISFMYWGTKLWNYALYRFLSISNKFCFQVYCTVYRYWYNLTSMCTILPHCVQSYGSGALKGGGTGPETSHVLNHWARLACLFGAHVHKNTNGHVFLYSPVRYDFDAGKSNTWAIGSGLSCSPLPMALIMDLPASKSIRTGPYK